MVAKAQRDEEIRWRGRAGAEETARAIELLIEQEEDGRVAICLRVRLGGEPVTMVAADYGYRDGSGADRVIKRLDEKTKQRSRPVAPSKGPSHGSVKCSPRAPPTQHHAIQGNCSRQYSHRTLRRVGDTPRPCPPILKPPQPSVKLYGSGPEPGPKAAGQVAASLDALDRQSPSGR